MKYIKYGFYSIVNKPFFNILIMLELAAILIVGNMSIAVYNSRSAFYDPYRDILAQDGFVFVSKGFGNYDQDMEIKKTLDSLDGDVTVINNHGFQLMTDDILFYRNVEAVEHNIFSKMKLKLEEGRWPSAEKNEKGEIEAVVYRGIDKDDMRVQIGSVVDGTINNKPCSISIVGVIGEGSYLPSVAADIHTSNEDRSVMNFYNIPKDNDNGCIFFVSDSADEILTDPHNLGMTVNFMYYNSSPRDDTRQINKEKIMGISKKVSLLSEYNENSIAYLNEQYIKLLPILLCVFAIVLAELICSVAMNTNSQLRNYGIYFLCGCRWKDCLRISMSYSLMIILGGFVIGTASFLIFQNTEYAAIFKQHIAPNNIYITLIIATVTLILSLIIPFFKIHKTSPVETIKES